MRHKEPKKVAYVVWKGRVPGIYRTWGETQQQTDGFAGARFKGFTSMNEAQMVWNLGFDEYEKGRAFTKTEKSPAPKQQKPKAPKWATERARKLVKSASGSNTFTCTATSCTYPKCACGL